MYTARWVQDNHYIIGNREYGYDLASVLLHDNLVQVLPENQIEKLIKEIADCINKKAQEANDKPD